MKVYKVIKLDDIICLKLQITILRGCGYIC